MARSLQAFRNNGLDINLDLHENNAQNDNENIENNININQIVDLNEPNRPRPREFDDNQLDININNNDQDANDNNHNLNINFLLRIPNRINVNLENDPLPAHEINNRVNLDGHHHDLTINNIEKHSYLNDCRSYYSCLHCRNHLANHDHLVSRTFFGSHGRAHLFDKVVNVTCGTTEIRDLITGQHLVCDISCSRCNTRLGWKYQKAFLESQRYKEGKFVIELAHVIRENNYLEYNESESFFGHKPTFLLSKQNSATSNDEYSYELSELNTSNNNGSRFSMESSITTELNNHQELDSILGGKRGPKTYNSEQQIQQQQNSEITNNNNQHRRNRGFSFGEDLLFTFYDGWCTTKTNLPLSLSSTHFQRKRRSLYLESKPYDWKHQSESTDSSGITECRTTKNPKNITISNDRKTITNNNDEKQHDIFKTTTIDVQPSTSAASSSGVSCCLSIGSSSSCSASSSSTRSGFMKMNLSKHIKSLIDYSVQNIKKQVDQELSSGQDDNNESDEDETQFRLETDQCINVSNSANAQVSPECPQSSSLSVDDDDEYYDCYMSHDTC